MTRNSRCATGAAIFGVLAASPAAAIADSGPASPGSAPVLPSSGQAATVQLPASVLRCLVQAGYPVDDPTTVNVPPTGDGRAPATTTLGTTPVPRPGGTTALPVPVSAGTTALPVPVSGSTTALPVPVSGATTALPVPVPAGTTAIPVPGTAGTGPIPVPGLATTGPPGAGASSSAGFQCGQIIVNSTVYLVFVTVTTTTTTTTANGPQTAANGPVTITSGSPVTTTGPTTTTTNSAPTSSTSPNRSGAGKKPKHRPARHKKPTVRKRSHHHRARHHKRVVRIVLVRKGQRG
jgi:hypothetical protein